jgi:hypothetical protein
MTSDRIRELERFVLHAVVVAGKSAPFAYAAMERFLEPAGAETPFDYVRRLVAEGRLFDAVKEARLGNYRKMVVCFSYLVKSSLNLETCTVDDLEAVPYIGCKTSRFFIMYTRPSIETGSLAVIDTHTWKWVLGDDWARQYLKDRGVTKIPEKPPTTRKSYRFFEQLVVADAQRKGLTCQEWDARNWDEKSKFRDEGRNRISVKTGFTA